MVSIVEEYEIILAIAVIIARNFGEYLLLIITAIAYNYYEIFQQCLLGCCCYREKCGEVIAIQMVCQGGSRRNCE